MRHYMAMAVVGVSALAVACSDDDPVETEFGAATAVVTDDAGTAAAFRGSDPALPAQADGTYSGTITGDAHVEISVDGETWVDVGSPTAVQVEMRSAGDESMVSVNASIPVGAYSRVRLTLSDARADIDAGAVLGGVSVTGAIAMTVGGTDGEVVIEKSVEPFNVTSDTHARILFDLNTELWVNQENAQEEEAEDDEVEDAATADREIEERG